ncbi:hypothetical protein BDW22DRAFT_1357722 [Trametopsis cervina]|nr:hypothetical protein BDW22DRAFT_1357722 [Trametopsis cervina]
MHPPQRSAIPLSHCFCTVPAACLIRGFHPRSPLTREKSSHNLKYPLAASSTNSKGPCTHMVFRAAPEAVRGLWKVSYRTQSCTPTNLRRGHNAVQNAYRTAYVST